MRQYDFGNYNIEDMYNDIVELKEKVTLLEEKVEELEGQNEPEESEE